MKINSSHLKPTAPINLPAEPIFKSADGILQEGRTMLDSFAKSQEKKEPTFDELLNKLQ